MYLLVLVMILLIPDNENDNEEYFISALFKELIQLHVYSMRKQSKHETS